MERIQNEVNNTSDEKGLNMGFFSKLFYFYNIHLSCCSCAILDSVVRDTIHNCLQNDEGRFDGLKAAARLYNRNAFQAYWDYVQAVATLAPKENGVKRSDKVEYALWL